MTNGGNDQGVQQDDERRRRKPALWLILGGVAVVIVVIVATVAVLALTSDDEADATTEIFLQRAGEPGPDPFMPTIAITGQDKSLGDERPTGGSNDVEVSVVPGSRPGLFGGTENQSTCDRDALIDFLAAPENLAKGEAWAAVEQISVDKISAYVRGLTPLRLRFDTRVTNHGFRNNVANPYQAVLEAGTAVLVDEYGVPRARCACGNPLIEPEAQASTTFKGDPWEGFNPSKLKVATATEILTEFVVSTIKADQTTGVKKFKKPVGTDGEADAPLIESAPVTTTTTTSTTTTAPAAAPAPAPTPAPAPAPAPTPAPTQPPDPVFVPATPTPPAPPAPTTPTTRG